MKNTLKALFAAGGAITAALGMGAATTPAQAQGKTITLCWAAWDPANALVELSKDFTAKTGIGINNRRNVHGVDDVSGQLRYLGQGKQTNIRHARRCIREAGPTNVNCIEAGTFHLSGHDRIRHAGHCHTALGNEFPKPARLTLLHYFFLPTLSLARDRKSTRLNSSH